MKVVQFNDVWEMYRIKFIEGNKPVWENYWALKDISFEVKKGETLGIIGENGSGKSTVLKLIAGMLKPDRGKLTIKGRVSGLLELGAGFEYEMTGRDNIYILSALYGLNRDEVEKKFEAIADFADIGRFINAPVKNYSSGMFVRLAFSLAIHIDPEILLIDDALAVGDEFFQRKCLKKIFELKNEGKTIVFVTHDMNMLRRLCERVIFLRDGRIVKDDLADKVIPLYTQMIGVKKGVGVLEKKPLNLVFNNGRAFINYNDTLLTLNSGIYTVFRMQDKWYSSLQADWEIESKEAGTLVARGKLYQLGLTQVWKLEVANNCEIRLDIEVEADGPFEIQEACTNVMLINEYVKWFTTLEKGSFPPIQEHHRQWQALLEGDAVRKCIGVKPDKISDKITVPLIFEQSISTQRSYSQIWNTDYFTNCRVLQYREVGLLNYARDRAESLVYFSGKILMNITDTDSYLEKLQDELTLTDGRLKLQFNKGQGIIFWNGRELTKINNINTLICANDAWHPSELASWEFEKKDKNTLIARGVWPNLPLIQTWEIQMYAESSFSLKIDLEVEGEVDIKEQCLQCVCLEDYKSYYSKYGQEEFPDNFLEGDVDAVQRCISTGEVGLISQNKKIPSLSLKLHDGLGNFAKIFNSDMARRARILSVEKVEAEEDVKFSKGKYPCFKIDVALGNEGPLPGKNSIPILKKDKLKFIFEDGRGRIHWDNRELTKRLGVYTSLCSQGRWHDSSSGAVWTVEETRRGLKCFGKWINLPVQQHWQVSLEEDKAIEFRIAMIVNKKFFIDRMQANIMLSENYTEWLANKHKGKFPPFKGDIDSDWELIYSNVDSGKKEIKIIGVAKDRESGNLPAVKFFAHNIDSGWQLNVINSDLYHRGRVLQYLKKEKEHLVPGEYLYCEGAIVIGDR